MRMPKQFFDLVRDRAAKQGASMHAVIVRAVLDSMSQECPMCAGTGRIAPDMTTHKEAPAPLATAGGMTAQEDTHEQQQPD